MSDYTLIIGNKNYSSWSLRPWIWMKQAGIAFSEKRVPLFVDTTRQELEVYFSNYKLPVLKHGEFIVWDTMAILEYLAEQHPQSGGWPADARARALARSVSAEMHSSFTALRGAMPMNCRKRFPDFRYSEAVQADIDRISTLWAQCRSQYGAAGDWLFGEFTIADAMYAPVVMRLHGYDVKVTGVVQQYINTMLGNPHMQDWIKAGIKETEIIEQDEA